MHEEIARPVIETRSDEAATKKAGVSRGVITLSMVVAGFALQVVSYVFLATPWGFPPSNPNYSNPVMPFAPLLFILGVMLVFLAAVVYELLPDRETETELE